MGMLLEIFTLGIGAEKRAQRAQEKTFKRGNREYKRRLINDYLRNFPDTRTCSQEEFSQFVADTSPETLATWRRMMKFFTDNYDEYYKFPDPYLKDFTDIKRFSFLPWQENILKEKIGDSKGLWDDKMDDPAAIWRELDPKSVDKVLDRLIDTGEIE